MNGLADEDWRLIREEARHGPMQMALDEVAAETAGSGGPRTVRVYRWQPSTLSLGYNQAEDSVDWDFCERNDIGITRRPTGGGGIYHDVHADISYSIAVPAAEVPENLMDCYDLLCDPILDAFERMNVAVSFAGEKRPAVHQPCCYLRAIHPAHDILAGGRKISGNAQYRQRDAVLQHGSLSFSLEPEAHLGVFADHEIPPARFRERVTAIDRHADIDREDAIDALETALGEWSDATEGEWTAAELDRARTIAERKYDDPTWNREGVEPAIEE